MQSSVIQFPNRSIRSIPVDFDRVVERTRDRVSVALGGHGDAMTIAKAMAMAERMLRSGRSPDYSVSVATTWGRSNSELTQPVA